MEPHRNEAANGIQFVPVVLEVLKMVFILLTEVIAFLMRLTSIGLQGPSF